MNSVAIPILLSLFLVGSVNTSRTTGDTGIKTFLWNDYEMKIQQALKCFIKNVISKAMYSKVSCQFFFTKCIAIGQLDLDL